MVKIQYGILNSKVNNTGNESVGKCEKTNSQVNKSGPFIQVVNILTF